MAKLTITRTNQWVNRFGKIWVYMDNKILCKVSNGETLTLDIEPGQHQLFAQADWLSSETITLNFRADTSKRLEVGSPVKITSYSVIFPVIFFAIFFYITAFKKEFLDSENMLLILSLLFLITQIAIPLITKQRGMLYYMTWGRKKYIYLKEI